MLKRKHFFFNQNSVNKVDFFFSKKSNFILKSFIFLKKNIVSKKPRFCYITSKNKSCFRSFLLSRHEVTKGINRNKNNSFNKTMLNKKTLFFTNPFFLKIKLILSGRVFKWSVFKNKISFFFLHSNKKSFFFNKTHKTVLLKKSKTSLHFFFYFFLKKNHFIDKVRFVKTTNIFTKRGVLVKGLSILKKKGKVSSYVVHMLNFFIFKTFISGKLKAVKYNNCSLFSFNRKQSFVFYIISRNQTLDFFLRKNCFFELNLVLFNENGFFLIKNIVKSPESISMSSICGIFEWYEREVRDFNNYCFTNLIDSRPLLSQYSSAFQSNLKSYKKPIFLNILYKKLNLMALSKVKLQMSKFFYKFQTKTNKGVVLKITKNSMFYLFLYVLKKSALSFSLRKWTRRKTITLIKAPFHYKNSKKNVYDSYTFLTLTFHLPIKIEKKTLFFIKSNVFLNPAFFKTSKIKIRV